MNATIKRREFIASGARAGMVCCGILLCPWKATSSFPGGGYDDEKPDPAKLNYCGYQCPQDCPFLKGTLENNVELKKQAYEQWQIKERYGMDFDPETIFCYGCKTADKPEGVVLKQCTVRNCVMEKKLECCIQCAELAQCDKELWSRFPDLKTYMIEQQKKFNAE